MGTTNDRIARACTVVVMGGSIARTLGGVEALNTNLDLNGDSSPRVRPRVGEWAPADVPTTRSKRHQRWWTIAVATLVLVAVVAFGHVAYLALRGY